MAYETIMRQYVDVKFDMGKYYGSLAIMHGPELGDLATIVISEGKIERSSMSFGRPVPPDSGHEAVCQIINDLGYRARVITIELEEGGVGSSIEINGGLHKGAVVTIHKGTLRFVKIRMKDPEAGPLGPNLDMSTRRVDLHHPNATEHIKETLRDFIGPVV